MGFDKQRVQKQQIEKIKESLKVERKGLIWQNNGSWKIFNNLSSIQSTQTVETRLCKLCDPKTYFLEKQWNRKPMKLIGGTQNWKKAELN